MTWHSSDKLLLPMTFAGVTLIQPCTMKPLQGQPGLSPGATIAWGSHTPARSDHIYAPAQPALPQPAASFLSPQQGRHSGGNRHSATVEIVNASISQRATSASSRRANTPTFAQIAIVLVPKIFNALADMLEWVCQQAGVKDIFHYLDDFAIVGPPEYPTYTRNLSIFRRECGILGYPLRRTRRRVLQPA